MTKKNNWDKNLEKIRILVVHGMGEQKRFESVEEIAANMMKSLLKDGHSEANIQVIHADSSERHSTNASWRDVPVYIHWQPKSNESDSDKWIEVSFREVYWADLDRKRNFRNVSRFLWWALSICGVRYYKSGTNKSKHSKGTQEHSPDLHDLKPPRRKGRSGVSWYNRFWLVLTSIVFFPIMLIFMILGFVFARINIGLFYEIYRALFEYVGDVHLYQDWAMREMQLEGFNEKSRVGIQKRMVGALCQTASEYHSGEIQGYYVFAHSLGTVVSFNALMENEYNLPNYLNETDYNKLHAALTSHTGSKDKPGEIPNTIPKRPPWLEADAKLNRKAMLQGMRGFLTVGSPLEKIAILWPAIVPYNSREDFSIPIPWYNITDKQDIIGGAIKKYGDEHKGCYCVGSFYLVNRMVFNKSQPFTAHISYWYTQTGSLHRVRESGNNVSSADSLMDNLVKWIENYKALNDTYSTGKEQYVEALRGVNTPAAIKNRRSWSAFKSNIRLWSWLAFCFVFIYSVIGTLLFLFLGGETVFNFKWYWYSVSVFGIVSISTIVAGFCRGLCGMGEY